MLTLKDDNLLRDKCLIGGRWEGARNGKTFPVDDPATGALLAHVPDMGREETRLAIEAAQAAYPVWRAKTAKERARLLRAWFDLIMAAQEDLARLMTAEQGKPLAEARGEIAYAASFLEWFAEEGKRVYGDTIPSAESDLRIIVLKEPVGVVGAITPWNFPAAMITRKVAPALAAGCTVVIKPAAETPLTALALLVLAERAGIPAGVLNIVTGQQASDIGLELTESPIVRKLSFTGSTAVGKILMRQSASTVKKISLELGGNAPFIVFDDADLDAAVAGAVASKYRNAGQTCVCTNRFLVQSAVYDAFAEKLTAATKALRVGPGTEDGIQIGPLITPKALDKVQSLLSDATTKGAHVLTGGGRHKLGGTYFEPTVVGDATPAMDLARQEIFGPVSALFRFDTEAQALALANDTEFGLAAYVYARDLGRVWRVAEGLEYGIVGVNRGIISTEVAPFGGMKESGIGREGSKYGIEDYLEIKYVALGLPKA